MAKILGTFKANSPALNIGYGTEDTLILTVPKESQYALKQLIDEIKSNNIDILQIDVKKATKRRTLNQNDYLWVLITELAKVLKNDPWSVYVEMVKKYGFFYSIAVPPPQAEGLKKLFRAITDETIAQVNGKDVIKFYGYPGSSEYDKEQMQALLDGVINECTDLGIPTDTRLYEDRIYA